MCLEELEHNECASDERLACTNVIRALTIGLKTEPNNTEIRQFTLCDGFGPRTKCRKNDLRTRTMKFFHSELPSGGDDRSAKRVEKRYLEKTTPVRCVVELLAQQKTKF